MVFSGLLNIIYMAGYEKLARPKKKICVFPVTSPKKLGKVGRFFFFFFFFNFNFLFSLILPRNTTDALFARTI